MKLLLILCSFIFLSASTKSCKEHKEQDLPQGCYKGKLEIKELCMNYTISMQSQNFDPSMVIASWTDENTGKVYSNVFGLGSRCSFPDSLKAGDEFYFTVDSTTVQNCMVCMAYYPVPAKKLSIKVLNARCTKH